MDWGNTEWRSDETRVPSTFIQLRVGHFERAGLPNCEVTLCLSKLKREHFVKSTLI